MMSARLSILFALALTTAACAEGADRIPTPEPTSGFEPGTSSSGGTNSPSGETPTGASKVPSNGSIESMFEPPTSDKATPDSLSGVWARTNSGTIEYRIRFTSKDLTLAEKCVSDSKISHATVKIRENADGSITLLETKTAKGDSSACPQLNVQLQLAEWRLCADSYENDCLRLSGTSLSGVANVTGETSSSNYHTDKWIKLSD